MINELKIYDKLLQFSLFQGMSHSELMEVVAHTKMEFTKRGEGQILVREDDPCTHIHLLVSGALEAETMSDDRGYSVVEQLSAPYILQPERIFGIRQRYTSTFRSLSPCHFISIDKQEVALLLETQLVFRINLLNLIAATSQKYSRRLWQSMAADLRTRLVRFFMDHTLYPAGPKTYRILMTRLAAELNYSRLDVSRELHKLQDEQLLVMRRGYIEIPMLEKLLM